MSSKMLELLMNQHFLQALERPNLKVHLNRRIITVREGTAAVLEVVVVVPTQEASIIVV
jgi:hypothetical protein